MTSRLSAASREQSVSGGIEPARHRLLSSVPHFTSTDLRMSIRPFPSVRSGDGTAQLVEQTLVSRIGRLSVH